MAGAAHDQQDLPTLCSGDEVMSQVVLHGPDAGQAVGDSLDIVHIDRCIGDQVGNGDGAAGKLIIASEQAVCHSVEPCIPTADLIGVVLFARELAKQGVAMGLV